MAGIREEYVFDVSEAFALWNEKEPERYDEYLKAWAAYGDSMSGSYNEMKAAEKRAWEASKK